MISPQLLGIGVLRGTEGVDFNTQVNLKKQQIAQIKFLLIDVLQFFGQVPVLSAPLRPVLQNDQFLKFLVI